jgi:hypothetical protein
VRAAWVPLPLPRLVLPPLVTCRTHIFGSENPGRRRCATVKIAQCKCHRPLPMTPSRRLRRRTVLRWGNHPPPMPGRSAPPALQHAGRSAPVLCCSCPCFRSFPKGTCGFKESPISAFPWQVRRVISDRFYWCRNPGEIRGNFGTELPGTTRPAGLNFGGPKCGGVVTSSMEGVIWRS